MAGQPALSFAGLVRQLRTGAGLTQEELAQAAGLPVRTLSDLERGVSRTAHKDTAGLLAGALGLAGPAAELFVAAARGKAAAAEVMAARQREALAVPAPPASAPVRAAVPEMAAGAGVVPRQLPAGAGFFAGREAELKELDELLNQAGPIGGEDGGEIGLGGPGGAVVISAVAGMAGVGKTALAVHWARKVAHRFPDGQLYVNLRGYGPGGAVTPEEATGWFLPALGVPAAQIPADAQARQGLYRSVLAGRRVLVVLDNARDAAQVRPLLPGSPGCLVIVTSRSLLAGLAAAEGARPLRLGPLDDEESALLLAARLGPERVAAEPEAVTELAGRCGHLPLALAVMAARAAADPDLPLGVLAAQLARTPDAAAAGQPPGGESPGRLEVLDTGDPATSLSELLSWSHRQLPELTAATFALLGLHCGPDITIPAAASLAGVPHPDARRALAELADASLAAEHRPGRYVMHDLVRSYAAAQARQTLSETEIRAAIGRSLDHYLHTMAVWSDIPRSFRPAPPAPGVVPERLAGEAQQVDWAWAEHQVLLRAIAQAAGAGRVTQAWQIFERQSWFLGDQGYWADCQAASQAVLAAAQDAGDHAALGWTHMIIGRHCAFAGALDEGRAHLTRAQDHLSRAGDLRGQASALLLSSYACGWQGDWANGATLAGQALALLHQNGRQGRWALYAIGECHAHLGNYDLARGYAQQALELGPEPGDPTNLALAWGVLGLVHHRLGERHHAMSCYRQALLLANQWKTPLARRWLASLLADFGDACAAASDLPAAARAWQQALQILDELGLTDNLGVRARLERVGPPG